MRKKIISILSVAAISVMGLTMPASAEKTELINLDFEDMTFEEFKNSEGVTISGGMAGDELLLETENASTGNKAIKFFRKAENVADADNKNGSNVELGFRIVLPEAVESGVVRVSFKVRTADGYSFRSRWKALGTTTTSDKKTKAAIVSHATYIYTNGTSNVIGSLNSNNWYSVAYDVYIDENKVVKGMKSGAEAIPSGDKIKCNAGDLAGIEFIVAYTNAYWTSCNSGDLCYWVDDIKITTTRLAVTDSSIADGDENVSVDTPVTVTFDSAVNANADNITILENGEKVTAVVNGDGTDTISITPELGYQYNSEYKVTVNKSITSTDGNGMMSDYEFSFKTVSVIDTDIEEGARYTEGFVPQFNEASGITYQYKITPEGGEETDYDKSALEEIGKYSLKITATDEKGRTEEKVINFEIIGAVAPLAENVKITGEPQLGTVLTGSYDFKDENDDTEGETTFKWYRAEEKDGEYKEIEGATSKEYTLTVADEDKYIKFAVTPVSVNEPYVGEETFSAVFVSAMNPKAENIKIEGEIGEGNELTVSYDYFDENDDVETESIITWYAMDKEDGEGSALATGKSYTLTENENDKFIKIGIIPKNAGSGKQDKEFFSDVLTGAFRPVASDVEIIGNLKSGSSVGVDYKYFDKNGDVQGESEFTWYVDGDVAGTGESYTITSKDKGKKIYVEVVPVSTVAPFKGEAVKSETKSIASKGSTTVSSGGKNTGGGGSFGGGSSVTPSIVPINPEVVDKLEEIVPDKENVLFNDIENHWAKDAIVEMAEKGIINGKSENVFAPDDNIKRAEFAALIARAFEIKGGENIFEDVSDDAWYKDVVSAVANAGIMNGSDGKFRPDAFISRQEIAVVLSNIARNKGIYMESPEPEFEDFANVAEWARKDVSFVISKGLLKGMSDKQFAPLNDATRAQIVVILKRLLEQ